MASALLDFSERRDMDKQKALDSALSQIERSFGKGSIIDDIESKRKALNIIMQHYSRNSYEYPDKAVKKIVIIKVEIEHMTGKQSGY